MGVPDCSERANWAAQVRKVSDQEWASMRVDSALLNDCMGLPKCVERANQAAKLKAIRNWAMLFPNDPLLKDCMGYLPCIKAANRPKINESTPQANEKPGETLDPKLPIFNQ
jgi:hypothetical protein